MFQGGRNRLTDCWLNKKIAANKDDEPCTSSSLVSNTQRHKPKVKRKEPSYPTDRQKELLEQFYEKIKNLSRNSIQILVRK